MPDMTLAMAREILKQGHKYDAWEGDLDKVSDEQALKDAGELVQLATNAFDGGVRSDAVMEILFACTVEPPAEQPDKYDEVYARHPDADKPAATEPEASEGGAKGNAFEGATDDSGAGGDNDEKSIDINSIVPGYDDVSKTKLVKAITGAAASGDLTPEEWEQIKAYEAANEERKSILELELEFKKPEPKPAPKSAPSAAGDDKPNSEYGDPAALAGAYEDGTVGTDRVVQQGLPVPKPYQGEEPILPVDITETSDKELSRLTMRFHALEAHTLWLASQEAGRRDVCAGLAQDAWDDAFSREFARLKEDLEKETASAIENVRSEAKHSANIDETVRTWKTRERRHASEARSLSALAEGYEKGAARLSREQTRRERLTGTPQG